MRKDLELLVEKASRLGFYSNLVTSGIGLKKSRLHRLKEAGLNHIQLSIQGSRADINDLISGRTCFELKMNVAKWIKDAGYSMVLNVVLHRYNIDFVEDLLTLAERLGADYLELANVQYDGWAYHNRFALLPSKEQVDRAYQMVEAYRKRHRGPRQIYFVVPDYHEDRPKACANGWGQTLLVVAPDGLAMPCHGARKISGLVLPNVQDHSIEWIWEHSAGFNRFRGDDWMPEPCRSCPEKEKDHGGCRCQAFLLTGDAANTDPVCQKSPYRAAFQESLQQGVMSEARRALLYRDGRRR